MKSTEDAGRIAVDVALTREDFHLAIKADLSGAGITGVYGPSGSGKSTLLRVIAGLEPQARGSIEVRGKSGRMRKAAFFCHPINAGWVLSSRKGTCSSIWMFARILPLDTSGYPRPSGG